jgi:signal transduction histidine kinase
MASKRNIYFSFIARVTLLMVLMIALTTYLLYQLNLRAERAIKQEVDDHLDAQAAAVDVALRSMATSIYLPQFVEQNPIPVHLGRLIHHIVVTDSRDMIIDSTHPPDFGKRLVETGRLRDPEHETTLHEIMAEGQNPLDWSLVRLYSFPLLTVQSEGTERLTIHVLISWEGIPGILTSTSRNRLLAMGGMLSATGLILIWLVWRFTRPIGDLLRAERRVGTGDFEFQLKVRRRDEIGSLVDTFNEMVNQLKRNRELEEKLREVEHVATIGRLASGIAHEIRNPLNFINLSIDHVRDRFHPDNGDRRERFEEMLDSMKSEIARLNRLVTDFLSFGRPTKLSPQAVDLKTLVQETANPLWPQAEAQGVIVSVEGDDDLPKIQADPALLKICLSNLIINALQAMPGGGRLAIRLSHDGAHIGIEVSDTGGGIASEDLDKIFEPYYSTKEAGIGLGLALTKKLVQEHGGTITVASQPDQGSIFTITLPLTFEEMRK